MTQALLSANFVPRCNAHAQRCCDQRSREPIGTARDLRRAFNPSPISGQPPVRRHGLSHGADIVRRHAMRQVQTAAGPTTESSTALEVSTSGHSLVRKVTKSLPLIVTYGAALIFLKQPEAVLSALQLGSNPLLASILQDWTLTSHVGTSGRASDPACTSTCWAGPCWLVMLLQLRCSLQVLVFGNVILKGANILAEGSELLLEIVDPGIIGGLVLPVLGALPDALIIIFSGLGGSREEVAQQVAVGVGTLAGSTVMLLSIAWGGSIVAGRCDLDSQGMARDKTLTRKDDWEGTGVTTDSDVRAGARIMAASVLLYGSVQVPAILGDVEDPLAATIGGVTCLLALVAYCAYQVAVPKLQERKIAAARRKRQRIAAAAALSRLAAPSPPSSLESAVGASKGTSQAGGLVDSTGRFNREAAKTLFDRFDQDGDGYVDTSELGAMLEALGVATAAGVAAAEGELRFWLQELDPDADRRITRREFATALARWVKEKDSHLEAGGTLPDNLLASEEAAVEEGDSSDEEVEEGAEPLSDSQIAVRACAGLAAGLATCAYFSDPLVEALSDLSKASGVPPFFVAFLLTPLASNASELLSSLKFAASKRRRSASLTFAQVYGAVTMNNTLCLGLFLLVVAKQQLDWVYSSEVVVIVGTTVAIGAAGASRQTFPAWWGPAALALFPASLGLVWGLDTFLGWQ